jgi:DNA repair exonuclease SbcCD ATPase subunit
MFNSTSSYYGPVINTNLNKLKDDFDELRNKIENLHIYSREHDYLKKQLKDILIPIVEEKKVIHNHYLSLNIELEYLKTQHMNFISQIQDIHIKLNEQSNQNQYLLSKLDEQVKLNGELCKRLFELKN